MAIKRKKGCALAVVLLGIIALIILRQNAATVAPANSRQTESRAPIPEATPQQFESVKTSISYEGDLESENNQSPFPPIWCNYEKSLGFKKYAQMMKARGGVLFFFSKTRNVWNEIDVESGKLSGFSVKDIGVRWGNRPSAISNEPLLKKYLKGELPSTEVFLGKPISMEQSIQTRVRNKLTNNGIKLKDVVAIRGEYRASGDRLFLVVREIVTKTSGVRPFEIELEL